MSLRGKSWSPSRHSLLAVDWTPVSPGIVRMLGEWRVLITHHGRLLSWHLEPEIDLELWRGQRKAKFRNHSQAQLECRHLTLARHESVVMVGKGKVGGLSLGLLGSQLQPHSHSQEV